MLILMEVVEDVDTDGGGVGEILGWERGDSLLCGLSAVLCLAGQLSLSGRGQQLGLKIFHNENFENILKILNAIENSSPCLFLSPAQVGRPPTGSQLVPENISDEENI